jgi:putative membrane protein
MMGFGILIPILLVLAIVYGLGWRPGSASPIGPSASRQTPLEVLKERYARGEISRQEYEQILHDLE